MIYITHCLHTYVHVIVDDLSIVYVCMYVCMYICMYVCISPIKQGCAQLHRTWDWFEHVGYQCVHNALVEEMVTSCNVADELLALTQGHQLWQWEGLHILILAITNSKKK